MFSMIAKIRHFITTRMITFAFISLQLLYQLEIFYGPTKFICLHYVEFTYTIFLSFSSRTNRIFTPPTISLTQHDCRTAPSFPFPFSPACLSSLACPLPSKTNNFNFTCFNCVYSHFFFLFYTSNLNIYSNFFGLVADTKNKKQIQRNKS